MGSIRSHIPFLLTIRHRLLHLPQVIVSNLLKSPGYPLFFGFLVFSLIPALSHSLYQDVPFLLYLPLLHHTVQDFSLCTIPHLLLTSIFYPKNARNLLSTYRLLREKQNPHLYGCSPSCVSWNEHFLPFFFWPCRAVWHAMCFYFSGLEMLG